MRSIAAPFVVAPPAGARVQTRLGPSQHDAAVLTIVGAYLGRLASIDLARRCAVGPAADGRGGRKRALTPASSSRWAAKRWFLTADGEADKPLGNETIRVHPDEGWLELKLPAPLAHLANIPHGRYRLTCPVRFAHRGEE